MPAALMARELGIPMSKTLCISSYDYDNQRELVVKAATTAGDGEGWLVVDDLVGHRRHRQGDPRALPQSQIHHHLPGPMGEPWWMTSKSPFHRDVSGLNSPRDMARWSSPKPICGDARNRPPVATSDSRHSKRD